MMSVTAVGSPGVPSPPGGVVGISEEVQGQELRLVEAGVRANRLSWISFAQKLRIDSIIKESSIEQLLHCPEPMTHKRLSVSTGGLHSQA
jgi:hypothetical protein